jgi:hypothetical protein
MILETDRVGNHGTALNVNPGQRQQDDSNQKHYVFRPALNAGSAERIASDILLK